jgi:hypothetical protein
VLVPAGKTFFALGGINGTALHGVTLQVEGTLVATTGTGWEEWPTDGNSYLHFMEFTNSTGFSVTGKGLLDGKGACGDAVCVP